jgi:hypothetical protein
VEDNKTLSYCDRSLVDQLAGPIVICGTGESIIRCFFSLQGAKGDLKVFFNKKKTDPGVRRPGSNTVKYRTKGCVGKKKSVGGFVEDKRRACLRWFSQKFEDRSFQIEVNALEMIRREM